MINTVKRKLYVGETEPFIYSLMLIEMFRNKTRNEDVKKLPGSSSSSSEEDDTEELTYSVKKFKVLILD